MRPLAEGITAIGYSPDLVDAAMAVSPQYFHDCSHRVQALHRGILDQRAAMERLVTANKRIKNILRQNDEAMQRQGETPADNTLQVDEELLSESAERAIYKAVQIRKDAIRKLNTRAYYGELMRMAQELDAPLADFFDTVLVMTKEVHIRHNRIALLREVRGLFMRIADFSKLSIVDNEGDDDETVPD